MFSTIARAIRSAIAFIFIIGVWLITEVSRLFHYSESEKKDRWRDDF